MGKKQAISYFILAGIVGFFGFTAFLVAAAWGGNPYRTLAIIGSLFVLIIVTGFGVYNDKKWAQWSGNAIWILIILYLLSYTRFFINISQAVTLGLVVLVFTSIVVFIRRKFRKK